MNPNPEELVRADWARREQIPPTVDAWGAGTVRAPVVVPVVRNAHDAAVERLLSTGWHVVAQTPAGTHLAKPLNHVLHFLIGLVTFGAWWLVWLVLAMRPRRRFVPRGYDATARR